MSYYSQKYYNSATGISGNTPALLIGPISVDNLDKFAVCFQNNNTAITFLELQVQAALDSSATAADLARNWVQINTGTLPQPSALGATATVLTSAVDNAYKYIRVVGSFCQTVAVRTISVHIGGFQRFRD